MEEGQSPEAKKFGGSESHGGSHISDSQDKPYHKQMKFSKVMSHSHIELKDGPVTKSLRVKIDRTRTSDFTWKYESLNFDLLRTKVFKDRKKEPCTAFMEWIAYALVGIFTGLTTAIMSNSEVHLIHEKRLLVDKIIGGADGSLLDGWLFFSGVSILFVLVASVATVYIAPGATGSGNAELIAYLNGVNYPKLIGFETLVVKIFGVIFAVIGGLCVGKEGPLAHIGANIGAVVPYLPLPRFNYLRNDRYKRELIAAGCSAGVSTAFGAPIGGALFAYEMSKPNTFWKFSVLWKSFFSCAIAVFSVAIFSQYMRGVLELNVKPVELKFGGVNVESPEMASIPCAVIVGIVCGILGAVFVVVNTWMAKQRKKYIKKGWQKVLEAVLFAFCTSSAFYWGASFYSTCKPNSEIADKNQELLVRYDCETGYHSPLATMFFNEELGAIRSIMSGYDGPGGIRLPPEQMMTYLAVWYIFTIFTYGVWVPAGLFLPGIIIGCAIGSIYEEVQISIRGTETIEREYSYAVVPILIAVGAMLSAYCRMTYSLVVIMLETTSAINIFAPMIIAVMVSRYVANFFTPSLYANAIRMKGIPILPAKAPRKTQDMEVKEIMSQGVTSLPTLCQVAQLKEAIIAKHSAYPVTNTANRLVGLIPRRMLIVLGREKAFYDQSLIKRNRNFRQDASRSHLFGNDHNHSPMNRNYSSDQSNVFNLPRTQNETGQGIQEAQYLSNEIGADLDKRSKTISTKEIESSRNGLIMQELEDGNTEGNAAVEPELKPNVTNKLMTSHSTVYGPEDESEILQLQYSSYWDERAGYPRTEEDEIVHWSKFNVNIYSDEVSPDGVLESLANDDEQLIDLRPYMIEFPQKVSRFAKLSKALEIFRTYHLRHLLVINPHDDTLAGIITRKDLSRFMQFDIEATRRF